MPRILGTSASERLVGTAVADQMNGAAGDDRLDGGGGNDFIRGGAGVDFVFGGTGNDTFSFVKGDLVSSTGDLASLDAAPIDQVHDLHGAGGYTTGQNDFLSFSGFSAGSTLVFDSASTSQPGIEYYHIADTDGTNHYFAVNVVDFARPPTAGSPSLVLGDYGFF